MQIRNETKYRTDDLRRILSICAERHLEISKRKRVIVTVTHARQTRGASGCAMLGGRHATIRITRDHPRPDSFACVAVHEFRHLNGWTHAQMKARYSGDDVSRYAWANNYGIRPKDAKPKLTREQKRAKRLEHAYKMHMKAITRHKRARTLMLKWARTVLRIRKTIAAQSEQIAAGGPSS